MATSPNPFDSFDSAPAAGGEQNPFDSFDQKPAAAPAPAATTKPRKKVYQRSDDSDVFGAAGETAVKGVPEGVASLVTGALLAPVSGIAGLASTGYHLAKGEGLSESLAKGGGTARSVQEMAYTPRSDAGEMVVKAAAAPIEVPSHGLGVVGEMVGGPAGQTIGENIIPMGLATLGAKRSLNKMADAKPVPGKDFSPLRDMSPEEAERFHRMKGQGVDPTLGQVSQQPAQVRFEQQTAQLPAGQRIFQRIKEQDAALADNVEKLRGKGATPELTEKKTGQGVRTVAEREYASRLQKVDDLYEKARAAGETKQPVDVTPLVKYLKENEAAAIAVKELRSAKASLNKLLGVEDVPEGTTIGSGKVSGKIEKKAPADKTPEITVDDLEFLRQQVGTLSMKDGSVKKYMGDIRQIIDKVTDGKGGDLYKKARAERKKLGDDFEEQRAVAGIIEKESRTDYKTAVEDVWKKVVIGGDDQDLSNVLRVLKSTDEKNKPAAVQSIKDMQATTIDHILGEATKTGTMSPAAFEKAMNAIGTEKLAMLLGEKTVKALKDSLQSAKDMKKPPLKVAGSDTNLNLKTMAERMSSDYADHLVKGVLPGPVGRVYSSVKEGLGKRAEQRHMSEAVDESLTPRRASLADIKDQAEKVKKERRQYVMGEAARRAGPAIAATTQNADEK